MGGGLIRFYVATNHALSSAVVYTTHYKQQTFSNPITKTYLYNFDPLKPHFYTVKLGFTLFFLISAQNVDCGYSLETTTHNLCCVQKYEKKKTNKKKQNKKKKKKKNIAEFLSENFQCLVVLFIVNAQSNLVK